MLLSYAGIGLAFAHDLRLASEPGAKDASLASSLQEALRFHQHLDSRSDTLIGHSLGGAAVLSAAHGIPEAKAVVTIAAPSDPSHVVGLFGDQAARILGVTFRSMRYRMERLGIQ